ncbi:hypothetical protein DV706_14275 [Natronorubrum bangense]|uniref:Uncharacterized protein n=2 Tax=Natronorubrum bangense TaxID=61858 RepID=L9WKA4_9EURY|nr:hypothetical protein C494_07890 [Natronorubrum bangense JCM 10635]QCC55533.1 hypothetical protein DV706_14275 [Natronorubrum bangense]
MRSLPQPTPAAGRVYGRFSSRIHSSRFEDADTESLLELKRERRTLSDFATRVSERTDSEPAFDGSTPVVSRLLTAQRQLFVRLPCLTTFALHKLNCVLHNCTYF